MDLILYRGRWENGEHGYFCPGCHVEMLGKNMGLYSSHDGKCEWIKQFVDNQLNISPGLGAIQRGVE